MAKSELVQLSNHRPESAVEIQLLMENSEERLSDEQVERVIEIVAGSLPVPEEEEDGEEEEAAAEEVSEEAVEEG